jgi:hypothetical protein
MPSIPPALVVVLLGIVCRGLISVPGRFSGALVLGMFAYFAKS